MVQKMPAFGPKPWVELEQGKKGQENLEQGRKDPKTLGDAQQKNRAAASEQSYLHTQWNAWRGELKS